MALKDVLVQAGASGLRTAAKFKVNWDAIKAAAGTLPVDYSGLAGRVPRVNAGQTGLDFVDDFNFTDSLVGGGRICQLEMPSGNRSIPSTTTGYRYASLSVSNVTWTLDADAPVGSVIGWVQLGAGVVTFAVGAGATLTNPDGQTKSGGLYAIGQAEVIGLNVSSKAIWKLTGETQA